MKRTAYVIQRDYDTGHLESGEAGKFEWRDERIYGEDDEHLHPDDSRTLITAEEAAKAGLERLRARDPIPYIRGYRLVHRTTTFTDKLIKD